MVDLAAAFDMPLFCMHVSVQPHLQIRRERPEREREGEWEGEGEREREIGRATRRERESLNE